MLGVELLGVDERQLIGPVEFNRQGKWKKILAVGENHQDLLSALNLVVHAPFEICHIDKFCYFDLDAALHGPLCSFQCAPWQTEQQ
jgi:hypothetical protein